MKKICVILAAVLLLTCLFNVGACAEGTNATPSIEAKKAPTLAPLGTDDEGEIVAEIIYHDSGEVFKNLHSEDVKVTAYADRASSSASVRDALEKAFAEIDTARNLGDLNSDLSKTARKINWLYNGSIFVAYELFDLTVTPEYAAYLSENGYDLKVRFSTGLGSSGNTPYVMHRDGESEEWILVDPENVKDNEDGTFDVIFTSLCPIAFLKTDVNRFAFKIEIWFLVLSAVTVAVLIGAKASRRRKN